MSALRRLFKKDKSKEDSKFSARRQMVRAPPPGQVTDTDDPHHEVWKPQFSCGDQTDESRIPFYNSGFAACPRCGEKNIWRFEEKAGIRPNGDTFGTEVFMCQTKGCGWSTSFMYDDGVQPTSHFEARHWPRSVLKFPVTFMMMWADRHGLNKLKHQIFSKGLTGDRFLELQRSDSLGSELALGKKDVAKVTKALDDPRGALLISEHR
ncbi:hypothetical protein RRG08_062071 [Elysia crispata]|uniref:Uncharacterized protein n=1 Tax=Elysia crispata TaxID=231223 RepID=A0AAE0ZI66_9GAST|nr:hypothetical protein RRG08_062071 [Elysia crispata]